MRPERPSDREVSQQTRSLARGEEKAWRWLHDHYFAVLRSAAIARGTSPAEAPDLVQRTYLRVLRHARRFKTEPDLRSWLCCLLRCEAIDAARAGKRRLTLLEKFQHREELRRIPEHIRPLDELLASLSPGEQELMTLHYVEGWSQGDLAAATGSTTKAVESKLARLRKRVRDSILRRKAV